MREKVMEIASAIRKRKLRGFDTLTPSELADYIADCIEFVLDPYARVDEKTDFDPSTVVPGIYRIYWKDGGESLAAVGVKKDGARWLAPTNWVEPSDDIMNWMSVDRIDRVR